MQLVVGLSSEQLPAILRLRHFLQSAGAIAGREQEEHAQHARIGRGDGSVVR